MRPSLLPPTLAEMTSLTTSTTVASFSRRRPSLPAFLIVQGMFGANRARSRFSILAHPKTYTGTGKPFLRGDPRKRNAGANDRRFWTLAARAVGRVFKLRYLVGAGVGYGGYTVNKNVDKFKENLPDLSWMDKDKNISKLQEALNNLKLNVQEYGDRPSQGRGILRRGFEWTQAKAREVAAVLNDIGTIDPETVVPSPLTLTGQETPSASPNSLNNSAVNGSSSAAIATSPQDVELLRKELEESVRKDMEPALREQLRAEMEPSIADQVEAKLEPMLRLQLEQEILLSLKAKMDEELEEEKIKVSEAIQRNWEEGVERAFEEAIVLREREKMVEVMKHVEEDKNALAKLGMDLRETSGKLDEEMAKTFKLEAELEMHEVARVDLAEKLVEAHEKVH